MPCRRVTGPVCHAESWSWRSGIPCRKLEFRSPVCLAESWSKRSGMPCRKLKLEASISLAESWELQVTVSLVGTWDTTNNLFCHLQ